MNDSQQLPAIVLTGLENHDAVTLDTIQQLLAPHLAFLIQAWWFVWIITALIVIRYVYVHGVRIQSDVPENDLYSSKD